MRAPVAANRVPAAARRVTAVCRATDGQCGRRCLSTPAAAATAATAPAVTLPSSPFFALAPGLAAVRLSGRGRSLVATREFARGELLLSELPLAAAADPLAPPGSVCAACFLPLLPAHAARHEACSCGYAYCSAGCREAHQTAGHAVVCGHMAELDALCREQRANYPRVAAAALARSLGGEGVDFVAFWASVQALVTLSVPADIDALPPLLHRSYAAVQRALSARMEGDADGFWAHAFDARTYARLLGTLRLNAFSVALHGGAAAAAAGSSSSAGASSDCSGGASGSGGGAAGGCAASAGGSDASGGGGGCGSGGGGGCGGGSAAATERLARGGGTALYAVASLLNHDCAPSAEALLHAHARLDVRALRRVAPGDEVTISYLGEEAQAEAQAGDAPLGVAQRRAALAAGYGFECKCARCVSEAGAALRRPAARPAPHGAANPAGI